MPKSGGHGQIELSNNAMFQTENRKNQEPKVRCSHVQPPWLCQAPR